MHSHDDHHHHHHHHTVDFSRASRLLSFGIVLNLAFVVIEFSAGLFADSLALMSDAGHNLSDVAGLALALLAFWLLKLKPTSKFTYGYRKGSILISLLNAIILLIAVGGIGYESVHRFFAPQAVQGSLVIIVAGIGIVINLLSAFLFFKDKDHDLNMKGAYLHLMVDAAVSVGVVISGVIITYTGWTWIDPLISLVIMVVIIFSTWNLLRDSLQLSLDAVPREIDIDKIKTAALKFTGIRDIHHIHVWAMSTSDNAMTAHVVIDDALSPEEIHQVKSKLRHELEHLGISHATLETESVSCHATDCNAHTAP